jgi:predicted site-specific integrase-resolvase
MGRAGASNTDTPLTKQPFKEAAMVNRILQHQTRVAIYARVSTKDKGQEVENQLHQLREFSSSQGWAVYRDS